MKELLKRTKTKTTLMAICTILSGMILVIWPASSTMFICLCGWLVIIVGRDIIGSSLFSSQETGPNSSLL